MNPSKKFCLLSFPPAGARCRMKAAMTGSTSLLQVLAAADMDDAEDVVIREGLFAALRDFGAGNAAVARQDARSLGACHRPQHRRRASCGVISSRGTWWPRCAFRR
jgi:hypothetical protein